MVYLSRIYTKSGDQGETSLGDGSRVAKDHSRVAAYGTVDELNSLLGVMLAETGLGKDSSLGLLLGRIQNDLFDVGADLCLPVSVGEETNQVLRVQPLQAEHLEKAIDEWNARLQPLHSFILPGGSPAAAWCHLARTICRRAEREVVTLARTEPINPQVIIYLNRLSDLLFVLGRVLNEDGKNDVLWVPGKGRRASSD